MQTDPVICEIASQGLSAVGSPCPATNVPWFEMLPVIPILAQGESLTLGRCCSPERGSSRFVCLFPNRLRVGCA